MKKVTKIVLNAEQTKKFLSCFVQEAIQIANKRLEEKHVVEKEERDS